MSEKIKEIINIDTYCCEFESIEKYKEHNIDWVFLSHVETGDAWKFNEFDFKKLKNIFS